VKRSSALLAAAVSASALALPAANAAPLAEGLVGPLQIDVSGDSVYVSQSFIGTITRIDADGSRHDVVHEEFAPGEFGDVAGVLAAEDGSVAYTTTIFREDHLAQLKRVAPGGDPEVVADLWEHEKTTNPDGRKSYGFQGLSEECAAQVPEEMGGGDAYRGILDAHPYALAEAPGGGWYVADAGANAVFEVSPDGDVSTVYVGRPQPVRVTAEIAGGMGLPECTVGHDYNFESVPTDVEVSGNGRLFISLLPGGPEGPELGARGKVVRFNPETKGDRTILTRLAGGTNVALAPNRRIFATETFGGQIIKANRRTGEVLRTYKMKLPAAVEYADGKVYVTKTVFGNGRLVVLHP